MIVDEKLLDNPGFVKAIKDYVSKGLLIPKPGNFTPSSRTPWGGHKIRELMQPLGIPATGDVIGEAWMLSAHKSFPNLFEIDFEGQTIDVPLWLMGKVVPEVMPRFLTKLLNSGSWLPFKEELIKNLEIAKQPEILNLNYHDLHKALSTIESVKDIHQQMLTKNLSVQIHPDKAYCKKHPEKNWHSKTEAWIIVEAEEGAGLYLGLKEGTTEDKMRTALETGQDISDYLNFVEVKAGDAFFIPAGTPHAIGAGILLIEAQEVSETGFRYYDWGRTDASGKSRELQVEEALASTNWKSQTIIRSIQDEEFFQVKSIYLNKEESCTNEKSDSLLGVILINGELEILDNQKNTHTTLKSGRSFYLTSGNRFSLKTLEMAQFITTQ
ncbi:MAG: class I mannose-6-phosphate isomerase [bacterium]|nr:class I mannose-6-phosphate isomerase [bacterium]